MNNEYYDLQHLKAIPIAEYLHTTYGVEPAKRYNGYALYHEPYREDFNASMKVDFRENLWPYIMSLLRLIASLAESSGLSTRM